MVTKTILAIAIVLICAYFITRNTITSEIEFNDVEFSHLKSHKGQGGVINYFYTTGIKH